LELIHVGHSAKSRGINGNFKARIDKRFIADVLKARALFINLDGSKVPFLIESAVDKGDVILKLDEVDSPEAVSQYLSKELYLEAREVSEDNQSDKAQENPLLGYTLIDQSSKEIGIIAALLEYPDQLLAKVDYQGKEVLIPIHEDLIIELDNSNKVLQLEIVEGLLDL